MKKRTTKKVPDSDEMKKEYDFSGGGRGRYANRFAGAARVAVISPELARFFPDSDSVHAALSGLVGTKASKVRKARAQKP